MVLSKTKKNKKNKKRKSQKSRNKTGGGDCITQEDIDRLDEESTQLFAIFSKYKDALQEYTTAKYKDDKSQSINTKYETAKTVYENQWKNTNTNTNPYKKAYTNANQDTLNKIQKVHNLIINMNTLRHEGDSGRGAIIEYITNMLNIIKNIIKNTCDENMNRIIILKYFKGDNDKIHKSIFLELILNHICGNNFNDSYGKIYKQTFSDFFNNASNYNSQNINNQTLFYNALSARSMLDRVFGKVSPSWDGSAVNPLEIDITKLQEGVPLPGTLPKKYEQEYKDLKKRIESLKLPSNSNTQETLKNIEKNSQLYIEKIEELKNKIKEYENKIKEYENKQFKMKQKSDKVFGPSNGPPKTLLEKMKDLKIGQKMRGLRIGY